MVYYYLIFQICPRPAKHLPPEEPFPDPGGEGHGAAAPLAPDSRNLVHAGGSPVHLRSPVGCWRGGHICGGGQRRDDIPGNRSVRYRLNADLIYITH